MAIEIILDGNKFETLAGFYDEVEHKMTKGLDWKIGRNLDAFNDVLRGGFGIHEHEEPIVIRWINSEKSRSDLGKNETVKYTEQMLQNCHPDNIPWIKEELENLKNDEGTLLFDIIVEITRGHEHIQLKLE